jgi:hypothetical protein
LKSKNNFFAKNHCEIQVRTILLCTLYSIKYGTSVKGLHIFGGNFDIQSISQKTLKFESQSSINGFSWDFLGKKNNFSYFFSSLPKTAAFYDS